MLRPATIQDLTRLREIERAAGAAFRSIGMEAVADDAPPSVEELEPYVRAGRAWVADADKVPVAYLIADIVDGNGHVEQVSVHPSHAGQGLGRALIDRAAKWAADNGFTRLTLTTFTEVPWNGPYYARLGFEPVDPAQSGAQLRALREHEAEIGLDRWPRTAMSLPID
ncbi:hypothetical protein ASG90_18915 [Nocardioides sp. Soil797]|nr:hypothetical protein ASG90_18915 [Nocardioides sp. Soil797]